MIPRLTAGGSFFSAYYFPNAAWARSTAVVITAARSSCYPVGYTTKGSVENAKFYILSSQFESVAGGRNVQDIVGGVTPVDYDGDGAWLKTATQIQIPNSKSYDTLYYINGAYDYDETKGEDVEKTGWADEIGNYVGGAYDESELKGIIPHGLAFWYQNKNGDVVWTHSGAVPSMDKPKRVDFPNNTFCLRSNPYPVTFNINNAKIDSSEITPVDYDGDGAWLKTATQIQIPNSKSYDTLYYINGAYDYDETKGEDVERTGWADEIGNYVGGAYDESELKGNIPVMQGFWVKGVTGASYITFGL